MPIFVDVFMSPIRDNPQNQAALFAFLLLVLLDVVFGVSNALSKKDFSSTTLREGILHKVSEFGIVAVGVIVDGLLFAGLDLGFNGPVLAFFLVCLIVMELGSIMELLAEMNPDLANNKAFKLLASVKEPEREEGEED